MDQTAFTGPIDIETDLDWTREPVFKFDAEIDALETVQMLGEDLRAAREQVRQIMRYMAAAVKAARQVEESGERTQPQAIINHSGLARQTVYNMLGEAPESQ